MVGVNRAGSDPHILYGGRSLIVSPRGETVAEAGADPQVLVAKIDLAPLVEYRRQFPALADMRAELFTRLGYFLGWPKNSGLPRIFPASFFSPLGRLN